MDLVDENGPWQWAITQQQTLVSPERMKVPLSLPTASHWGLRTICFLERSPPGGS